MARPVNGNSKWHNSTFIMNKHTGASKKQWRSNHQVKRGKSWQITATDRIAEGIQKNNGNHFGGELLALFGNHLFCECMNFFYI